MIRNHLFYLLMASLLLSCGQGTETSLTSISNQTVNKFGLLEGDNRIVLVGGTLISSMENYGCFETSVLTHIPNRSISFRNIGWPADDVFGLARSQFGSAQNTRSWQPPSAEEGFGSKVLMEHILQSDPTTLIIGYGSEAAYVSNEEAFDLFSSGYLRLLNFADSLQVKIILLSPPKQELAFIDESSLLNRNRWLKKASAFIQDQANERRYDFIDLFESLIEDPLIQQFTENGVQLNRFGYQKMCDLLLQELAIKQFLEFEINLNSSGEVQSVRNAEVTNWAKTVRGVQFDLTPFGMGYQGRFNSTDPLAIYMDGSLRGKGKGSIDIVFHQDSIIFARLKAAIFEKNRLHRYRLRPLNEAYIYLFRRHEMGHLAYEMDDFDKLIREKEADIDRLVYSSTHQINIELIRPWQPPKNYPEDEVPAFVPEPNTTEELRAFSIPKGFALNLFAADPMIANPININWDTRGRAWVATSSTYPHIVPGREPNDRIIILEDVDGDGQADKSTVFADGLLVPHSVMPVPGGAYVASTTEFLFLADTNGDDIADERRVIFDGFGNADVHHMIHGLRWAPWGDLYFTQSIYINSFVETAYGPRQLNGSGTWSFRPEMERLEVFSRGLINPWGFTIDEWGQAFATDGAHSSGINYIFPESAHAMAVGAARVLDGLNTGTPKNTAAEVLYSRHLPDNWQGSILTNDFRANRTVRYQVRPTASGYSAEEIETVLHSDHRSYRPVDIKTGPDGAIYVVDWYNPIIDHGEVDFHHPIRDKTHGRIWRLTNKNKPIIKPPEIFAAPISSLLELLKTPEQYTRLQANRELVAQKCDPKTLENWVKSLQYSDPNFERHRLEALWLSTALNHYDEDLLMAVLRSSDPRARAAGVRVLSHWKKQSEKMHVLDSLINDSQSQVRLETVHALREQGDLQAVNLLLKVLDHPLDDNLDFATWLAIKKLKNVWFPSMVRGESVFGGDLDKQMYALITCEDPDIIPYMLDLVRKPGIADTLAIQAWHMMARIGNVEALSMVLEKVVENGNQSLLYSLTKAPASNLSIPNNLELLEILVDDSNPEVRVAAFNLIGKWKASQYVDKLEEKAKSNKASVKERLSAARALMGLDQLDVIIKIVESKLDPSVRATAAAVWIEREPQNAAKSVLNLLTEGSTPEDAELLFVTYRSMEEGPKILTDALAGRFLPEPIASAGLKVAQTSGLNLSDLEEAFTTAGSLKPIGDQMSLEEKNQLIDEAKTEGSRSRGYSIYRRPQLLCGTCHRVNGIGGLIGPDLSTIGSYMTPNSILESLLNPNSDIKQGYETVILTKTDGKVLSGTLYRKTDNATLVRIASGEIITVPAKEIDKIDVSPASLMPAGLTASLHRDELKDLIQYLTSLGTEN